MINCVSKTGFWVALLAALIFGVLITRAAYAQTTNELLEYSIIHNQPPDDDPIADATASHRPDGSYWAYTAANRPVCVAQSTSCVHYYTTYRDGPRCDQYSSTCTRWSRWSRWSR